MRISTLIFSLLVIGAIIAAGVWYMVRLPAPEKNNTVASLRLVKTPEFDLTITVLAEENGRRQLITCRQHTCRPEPMPDSAEGDPVFDGETWYRYEDSEKRKLQRFNSREQNGQIIVEETQFVRPRDLFISPTGQQVAYWLDNIREPRKQLTELWVYDSSRGSTHLVAEQIKQDNAISPVRWNRAGTHLWFVYQTEGTKQLRLFSTSPAAEVTPPKVTDPEKLLDVDITGKKLANTGVYAEWLPDGQLLYITQQADTFTLELETENAAETLATLPGFFRSAHTDPTGAAIIVASVPASPTGGKPPARPEVQTIYLKTGQSIDRFNLPTSASNIKVVLVISATTTTTTEIVPAKSLEDAELVAFIEKYLVRIVSATEPKASRIVMTDQSNTLFVEYRTGETSQRSLVTIRDALHPEWSLRARYIGQQGQWIKIEGSRLPDPAPIRVYEWEESLKQWIRKN